MGVLVSLTARPGWPDPKLTSIAACIADLRVHLANLLASTIGVNGHGDLYCGVHGVGIAYVRMHEAQGYQA
jgi:hypothetical protein